MKKILLFAALIISVSSCIMHPIIPSGSITTENRPVSEFKDVSVSAGIELAVYKGEQEVLVEAHENIHKHIDVYVNKGCLYIKPSKSISFRGTARIKVYVTNNVFNRIEASGGSKVKIPEGLVTDYLKCDGAGGSRFEGEIECRTLEIDMAGGGKADLYVECGTFNGKSSGGSVFNIEGYTDIAEIKISGGGHMSGFQFTIDTLYAELSGGATATTTVNEYLSAAVSGGSVLKYKGDAGVSVQSSGGSKVINAN